jgi:predicted nucleic acid-binding protein
MSNYVTDTQALVKFMMGKKVINDASHKAFQEADRGEGTIIIPAIVLMEVLYLFEKTGYRSDFFTQRTSWKVKIISLSR